MPTTIPDPLDAHAVARVTAAVRSALAVERGTEPEPLPNEGLGGMALFLRAAKTHRVSSLLADNSDAIGLPKPVANELRHLAMREAEEAMKLTLETVRANAAFNEAGIPVIVMKGVPLSIQTTGKLSSRGGGDIDLLVPIDQVRQSHQTLESCGWMSLRGGAPRPGVTWRLVAWVNRELPFDGPNSAADLHWRVDYDHHLFPPSAELIARGVNVDLGNHPVRTFAPSDALAACCFHVYVDFCSQLRGLVDVVRLTRLPGVALPPDSSPKAKQLASEILRFTQEKIGGIPEETLSRLGASPRVDASYAHELWDRNSMKVLHADQGVLPLRQFNEIYRHQFRYGHSRISRAAMFATYYGMDLASLDPAKGPLNIVGAVLQKGRNATQHRILKQD